MLKQRLSQKMLQKLSPQQIQLMKLLQIPTATLDQRIKEELEANPALDEGEDENDLSEIYDLESESKEDEEEFELDDYLNEYIEDDPTLYRLTSEKFVSEEETKKMPIAVSDTFHEYLEAQLGMQEIEDERKLMIAKQVIGSIDADGYLRRDSFSIIDDMLFSQNVVATEQEIEQTIAMVQTFDPPGICSRSLQESLIIQLNQKDMNSDEPLVRRARMNALKILMNHFDEFTKKHYKKLQKNLFLSEYELKDAINEILKLNPKPASGHVQNISNSNQYIVPDFIITNRDGEIDLVLNSKNAPDLMINDNYLDMLKSFKVNTSGRRASAKEKEAIMFIKQKIDSAKWFIDAIKQRQDTLYNTMYSILQFQYDFFTTGDERKLKPMILKDIAEITGLDISTVSRVANSKFVQTEFGTKRLKDFFSESLQTQDGNEVSTLEVKNILSDIISGENKKKPLSDEKLKDFLQQKGYNIARRTVAKYREQLNIPVARLRKEI